MNVISQNCWETLPLSKLCKFIPGKAHEPYIDPLGDFVCVNSKFVASDGIVRKTCSQNLTPARENDILLVMSDLPNGRALGKCYLVGEDEKLAVNQRVCILRPTEDTDPQLLFYALNRNPYFLSFDDGVNQTHLLNAVFERCELRLPLDTVEQQRIGQALTDADGVIAGLERLIAKKRQIKQGAMQDLLTARRRLPGFSGEWEGIKLGSCVSIISKGTTPTSIGHSFVEHGVNFIKVESLLSSGGVDPNHVAAISHETHRVLKRSQLQAGDILVSIAGAIGRVGIVDESVLPANTNQALAFIRLTDQSRLFNRLVPYLLKSEGVMSHWSDISVQGAQPNISLADVRNVILPCPPFDEQTAIAAVLSDMDAEIQALNARLTKAWAIKEGMMQVLLTGRVRLV